MRTLSHSETETLTTCSLAHDLRYVGNSLGGVTLKSRFTHYNLRRGSAWGIGVQVWHETGDLPSAKTLMLHSIAEDAEQQKNAGVYTTDAEAEHTEMSYLLRSCLEHYARTTPRLALTEPERKLLVKIPGLRGWRFECRLDGVVAGQYGPYPYESKLRNQLTSHDQIDKSRQPRWYAWAWREESHEIPAGFIVDERLAQIAPDIDASIILTAGSKARKDGSQKDPPRPTKHQACTAETYRQACIDGGFDIDPETADACDRKHDPATYHRRVVIRFTHRELDEAGEQIRSAARLIRLHERGVLTPIRNPSPMRCPGCAFRELCTEPTREMAEALPFALSTPKRFRGVEAATT